MARTEEHSAQTAAGMVTLEQIRPEEIEKRSFELISKELGERNFPDNQALVIKRVIHTTADFDYVDNLVFSQRAVEAGLDALRDGASIITDTTMAMAGINKKAVKKLGVSVRCFIGDADVAEWAQEHQTTRSYASMEKASRLGEACIFAVGNAPTALIHLYELTAGGRIHPKLIIGAPVGFVNVVQAKELILTLPDTPFIVARGRKGGSNVAAAICNALCYELVRKESRLF